MHCFVMMKTQKAMRHIQITGAKPKKFKKEKLQRCTQDEFYKVLKAMLTGNKHAEAAAAAQPMLEAIDEPNGFLPLQRINLNGQIPEPNSGGRAGENHLTRRESIIRRCGKIRQKIPQHLHVPLPPYYVGPLYQDRKQPVPEVDCA